MKKNINKTQYPIVYVEALDWNQWTNQRPITDAMPLARVSISGFLFREDKEAVWIAREIFTDPEANSENGLDVRGVIVIPKSCITKIIKI